MPCAILNYVAGKSLAGYYFSIAFDVQKHGNFLETVRMNMWEGQLANMTWALEHGRIFADPCPLPLRYACGT